MKRYILVMLLLLVNTALGQVYQPEVGRIYNAGQSLQLEGKHEESLSNFLRVVNLDPTDWEARTKVIQEYQALGKISERDAHREALLALREKGNIESLNERVMYVRDQFSVGINKVITLEYFDLKGDRAVRYSFMVLDTFGKKTMFKISLGSYQRMTEFFQAKGDLRENERVFHLDGYFPGGEHRTYGFFKGEPEYDVVRKLVIEILERKRTHVSIMKPPTEGEDIQIKVGSEIKIPDIQIELVPEFVPTKPLTATE